MTRLTWIYCRQHTTIIWAVMYAIFSVGIPGEPAKFGPPHVNISPCAYEDQEHRKSALRRHHHHHHHPNLFEQA